MESQQMRWFSPKALEEMTGLDRVTIWRMQRRGAFPPYARLSPGRVGLSEADYTTWSRAKAEGREWSA
jgi:predicted DNA-binding transcriptional regulator AlpA